MHGDGKTRQINVFSLLIKLIAKPFIISKFNQSQLLHPRKLAATCLFLLLSIVACGQKSPDAVQARPQTRGERGARNTTPSVDVRIARPESLRSQVEYTGTTLPQREVSLRSQIQGQLLGLNIDVGDRVQKGQNLGQVDDALLRTALNQAEAELASLQSEVARLNSQVANSRVEVERLRLQYNQAIADANRFKKLAADGAIPLQTAEQAQTTAQTAAKALRAAQEKVQTDTQAVKTAQGRVLAQTAAVAEAKKRRAYAQLVSPITGVVSARVSEPGNFLQPGGEVVRLSDFSQIRIITQVSELDLSQIRVGQPVQIRLDAFPDQSYTGKVSRIAPSADPTARLIPVEVVMSNPNQRISSGLLARVQFENNNTSRIVIPLTALTTTQKRQQQNRDQSSTNSSNQPQEGNIFVINPDSPKPQVTSRPVKLGKTADGKVEVLNGLQPGESYVSRSSGPLNDGDTVRLSILSEGVRERKRGEQGKK